MDGLTWVVVVGAIALTVVYHVASRPKPLWRPEKGAIVFLASALAIAVTIAQLRVGALSSKAEATHQRFEAAFRYMERWGSLEQPLLDRVGKSLDSIKGLSGAEADTFISGRRDLKSGLSLVHPFFEELGLAVKTGFADDRTLCLYFAEKGLLGVAPKTWRSLEKWVSYRRQQEPDYEFYRQFQELAEHWIQTRCQ